MNIHLRRIRTIPYGFVLTQILRMPILFTMKNEVVILDAQETPKEGFLACDPCVHFPF